MLEKQDKVFSNDWNTIEELFKFDIPGKNQ